MTVSLTPEIEQFVAEKVRSGEYRSAEEAVNGLLSQVIEKTASASVSIGGSRNGLPVFVVPPGTPTFSTEDVRRAEDEPE